ncbi:MAG: type II toxin-antitoxin system VapC family toxin [Chloroflexi bacterium]|nr:type II toxin-antitoxin system VapC family toxin [Chloroflexota bacterium]
MNSITIAEIAVAEVASAFAILVRRRVVSKADGDDAYRRFIGEFRSEYTLAYLTSALILAAAELTQRHPLKAYDAVQLALALNANKALQEEKLSLTFVTSDKTLLQAAQAEGLAAENPQDHAD